MNINLYVLPAEPGKTSESNTYTRLHCSMKILSKIMSSYSTLLKRELVNVFSHLSLHNKLSIIINKDAVMFCTL